MDFKLKANENGDVNYITSAGSDFVKSCMPEGQAKAIVGASGFEVSDQFKGFPILADGKYFEGSTGKAKSEPKADEEAKPVKKTTSKKK